MSRPPPLRTLQSEPARKKAKQAQEADEFDFVEQIIGDPDRVDAGGVEGRASSAANPTIQGAAAEQDIEFSDCVLCGFPHFSVHLICPTCLAQSYS